MIESCKPPLDYTPSLMLVIVRYKVRLWDTTQKHIFSLSTLRVQLRSTPPPSSSYHIISLQTNLRTPPRNEQKLLLATERAHFAFLFLDKKGKLDGRKKKVLMGTRSQTIAGNVAATVRRGILRLGRCYQHEENRVVANAWHLQSCKRDYLRNSVASIFFYYITLISDNNL